MVTAGNRHVSVTCQNNTHHLPLHITEIPVCNTVVNVPIPVVNVMYHQSVISSEIEYQLYCNNNNHNSPEMLPYLLSNKQYHYASCQMGLRCQAGRRHCSYAGRTQRPLHGEAGAATQHTLAGITPRCQSLRWLRHTIPLRARPAGRIAWLPDEEGHVTQ